MLFSLFHETDVLARLEPYDLSGEGRPIPGEGGFLVRNSAPEIRWLFKIDYTL